MNRELKCAICGNTFFSEAPRAPKYCSAICKEAGRDMTAKAWHEKNAGYMREYMQSYRPKQIEKLKQM